MPKKVFIAATKQNDGKTTVSLGLIANFKQRFQNVGFIKPIGQRYLEEQGLKVDEDSILIEEVCGIQCGLKDMSPIAVEKGFTERFIEKPSKNSLTKQIKDSFKRASQDKDLIVIEGTGHAGVGSVFDHSNATVAKLLGAKAILISSGGVGRPIDEIVLNKALFDQVGVKLLGVIVNKVLEKKYEKIKKYVTQGLKRKGIDVLGVIPYIPMLSAPTIGQILDETKYKLLCGRDKLSNQVSRILVGAMEPHYALNYLQDGCLLITAGDREDLILTAISLYLSCAAAPVKISGIVLSGNIMPHKTIGDLVVSSGMPVLLAKEDTYRVASAIHDLTVKLRPRDNEKISKIIEIIKQNVDIDKIIKGI